MFRDRMDEWYDMSRAVHNNRYRYIHNFMAHRIYGLPIGYLFRAKSIQSWKKACEGNRRRYTDPFSGDLNSMPDTGRIITLQTVVPAT